MSSLCSTCGNPLPKDARKDRRKDCEACTKKRRANMNNIFKKK